MIVDAYDSGVRNAYGIRLSPKQRRTLWFAVTLEAITRYGAYTGVSTRDRARLISLTQQVWVSLFLAISDDDFDTGLKDEYQWRQRMVRIYATIEYNFHATTKVAMFAPLMAAFEPEDLDFGRSFLELAREHLSVFGTLNAARGDEFLCLPVLEREVSSEEAINHYGAASFGVHLARIAEAWVSSGANCEPVQRYVSNCAKYLIVGAKGQLMSARLRCADPMSLGDYMEICRRKSGSIIRICSELRMIGQLPEVEAFYDQFDPFTLQLALDDLIDFSEDSSDGVRGILHIMIEEQGQIARSYGYSLSKGCEVLIPKATLKMLHEGRWSVLPASHQPGQLVSISSHVCREMLENKWIDRFLSFRRLLDKRISSADLLRQAIYRNDAYACERVALQSGIFRKFRTLFRRDQAFVTASADASLFSRKAYIMPLFVLFITYCLSLVFACRAAYSWRARWSATCE